MDYSSIFYPTEEQLKFIVVNYTLRLNLHPLVHPKIKFTLEHEQKNSLFFLDLTIYGYYYKFHTTVYI